MTAFYDMTEYRMYHKYKEHRKNERERECVKRFTAYIVNKVRS